MLEPAPSLEERVGLVTDLLADLHIDARHTQAGASRSQFVRINEIITSMMFALQRESRRLELVTGLSPVPAIINPFDVKSTAETELPPLQAITLDAAKPRNWPQDGRPIYLFGHSAARTFVEAVDVGAAINHGGRLHLAPTFIHPIQARSE